MSALLISIHWIESDTDTQGLSMLGGENLPGIHIQLVAGIFSFVLL